MAPEQTLVSLSWGRLEALACLKQGPLVTPSSDGTLQTATSVPHLRQLPVSITHMGRQAWEREVAPGRGLASLQPLWMGIPVGPRPPATRMCEKWGPLCSEAHMGHWGSWDRVSLHSPEERTFLPQLERRLGRRV